VVARRWEAGVAAQIAHSWSASPRVLGRFRFGLSSVVDCPPAAEAEALVDATITVDADEDAALASLARFNEEAGVTAAGAFATAFEGEVDVRR